MEDYWKVPRELIYCEKENLNDFGVKEANSLNGRLFKLMSEHFLSIDDAKTLILQCFNNAYYLCTIILLEEFPNLCVDKYEKNLLDMKVRWNEDACAASFALAYEMLQVYDQKWQKDCPLLQAMHKRFHSGYWRSVYAANSFNKLIDKIDKSGTWLPTNTFAPRDIVEVVETINLEYLRDYAEYVCERISQLDDPHQRKYWSDTAIARINEYQRTICKNSNYNPNKDCFKLVRDDYYIGDSNYEERIRDLYKQNKEAINYYKEHYQKKEENASKEKTTESSQAPEIKALQAEISKLRKKLSDKEEDKSQQKRIEELEKEVENLKNQLKEVNTIPKIITAQQRVRMELARLLMEKAGIDKTILDKWGNKDKAGSIMSIILDIPPTTCKTYLSDPTINKGYHKETILSINTLLEALELDFRL